MVTKFFLNRSKIVLLIAVLACSLPLRANDFSINPQTIGLGVAVCGAYCLSKGGWIATPVGLILVVAGARQALSEKINKEVEQAYQTGVAKLKEQSAKLSS